MSRNYFDTFCILLVEIKGFNVLIKNKPIFQQLINVKQEAYKKLVECQETMTIK